MKFYRFKIYLLYNYVKEILIMELAIRNKWITLRGSSIVKDLNEKDVMKIRGKFWSFTAKKFVQDLEGNTNLL